MSWKKDLYPCVLLAVSLAMSSQLVGCSGAPSGKPTGTATSEMDEDEIKAANAAKKPQEKIPEAKRNLPGREEAVNVGN